MSEPTTRTIYRLQQPTSYEVHFHFYYVDFDNDLNPIKTVEGCEHIRYFDTYDEAMTFLIELDQEHWGKLVKTDDGKGYRAVSVGASSWVEEIQRTRYYELL